MLFTPPLFVIMFMALPKFQEFKVGRACRPLSLPLSHSHWVWPGRRSYMEINVIKVFVIALSFSVSVSLMPVKSDVYAFMT